MFAPLGESPLSDVDKFATGIPELAQAQYRFRTDSDAVDATPTWGASEDATYAVGSNPFRLRTSVANAGLDPVAGEYKLYLKKNSGSYAAITTSSTGGVKSYDASSDVDDTIIRVPRLYPFSPDWQLSGAAIDLDFAGNRIYGGTFTDCLSCSRASDGYALDSSGTWQQFSSNVLRITDLGLLVEDTRTNYLLQSGSPATQTTESLATGNYTLWVEGSGSALASGGTATITGAASATNGSPNTFAVTVAGTVTVTVTGTLARFQLEKGNFETSYIPTTTATAARATDSVTCTGALGSLLNSSPATIMIAGGASANTFNTIWLLGSGAGGEVLEDYNETAFRWYTTSPFIQLFSGIGNGPLADARTYKNVVMMWDEGNTVRKITCNGATLVSDTDAAKWGASVTLASWTIYRRIVMFNSALSDADLVSTSLTGV